MSRIARCACGVRPKTVRGNRDLKPVSVDVEPLSSDDEDASPPPANIKATFLASRGFDRVAEQEKVARPSLKNPVRVCESRSIVRPPRHRDNASAAAPIALKACYQLVFKRFLRIDRGLLHQRAGRPVEKSLLNQLPRNFTFIHDLSSRYPLFTCFRVPWILRSRFVPPRRGR